MSDTQEMPKPIWVRPKRACQVGGFGLTKCYDLIKRKKVRSRKVDGMRLVDLSSIEQLGADDGRRQRDGGGDRAPLKEESRPGQSSGFPKSKHSNACAYSGSHRFRQDPGLLVAQLKPPFRRRLR